MMKVCFGRLASARRILVLCIYLKFSVKTAKQLLIMKIQFPILNNKRTKTMCARFLLFSGYFDIRHPFQNCVYNSLNTFSLLTRKYWYGDRPTQNSGKSSKI